MKRFLILFTLIFLPLTGEASVIGSLGYPTPAPESIVVGFSPLQASSTATVVAVQYYLKAVNGGIAHQFILRNSNNSADVDCVGSVTTPDALGANNNSPAGALVTEYLTGTQCGVILGDNVYARITDGATNPVGAIDVATGYTWWALFDSVSDTNVTHIIDYNPYDGSVISSSTPQTINVFGYISDDDIDNNVRVHIHIDQLSALITSLNQWDYEWTEDVSGFFVESTTTTFSEIGDYRIIVYIIKDVPSFITPIITSETELDSETGIFTVDFQTQYNAFIRSQQTITGGIITSKLDGSENCNGIWSAFNIASTTMCLFAPDDDQVQALIQSYKVALFEKFPVGYLTRFVTILALDATSTGATTTIPSLSYSLPDDYPVSSLQGFNFDVDVAGIFLKTGQVMGEAVSANDHTTTFEEATKGLFTTMCALGLFIYIIMDLWGLAHKVEGSGLFGKNQPVNPTSDEYHYKEKLWEMKNRK